MRNKILPLTLAATVITACQPLPNTNQSPSEPVFNGDVVKISSDELSQYWVSPKMMVPGRQTIPQALPRNCRSWTYMATIDSRGVTVNKELLGADPEDCLTQQKLAKTPYMVYQPAESNTTKTPVRVEITRDVRR